MYSFVFISLKKFFLSLKQKQIDTSFENSLRRQIQSSYTNKAQVILFCEVTPTWSFFFSCVWKPQAKFPKVNKRKPLTNSLSFKKIPILSVFSKQVFTENQFLSLFYFPDGPCERCFILSPLVLFQIEVLLH